MKRSMMWILMTSGAFACSDGPGSDADSGAVGTPLGMGSMRARVDGDRWIAVSVNAQRVGGILVVGASDAEVRGLGFAAPDEGADRYEIGAESFTNANYNEGASASWRAAADAGSGWVDVDVADPDRVQGTFEFEVEAVDDERPPTRSITEGQFDLALGSGSR
jgi:hypothetical protein